MSDPNTRQILDCCLKGFEWDGTPTGTVLTLPGVGNPAYVTGYNPSRAIFLIHDLFGWTFPNTRLLADHYAREANATVYVPDFFGGDVIEWEPVINERWEEVNAPKFIAPHTREIREPEIFAYAKALRDKYAKVGAIGFCYGGWAVFRLGSKDNAGACGGKGLVDCVVAGHPTFLTEKDIDEVAVPVQMLAPEIDAAYTAELKAYTFTSLQKSGNAFDYQHFPRAVHACFVRGDPRKKGEREAMVRGKNAAVGWFNQWFRDE
ncbi:dienelactone hydrolase family protein [Lasiosphaeris hirsuta]|uniref:Dienelactone hydrolase family protein n=1 Tax=Lasiosphaeris hirsuta TaxID=260670 RepID=A0AA40AQN0_9PEZI|nr:dienelactone hydrolase family protein [Lasiosphaeris hirsuta]